MINRSRLAELFNGIGIRLSETQLQSFDRYARLLLEWNEKINLTAITDGEGIEQKHFLDSVLPFTKVQLPQGYSVIDIGTGAGFPSCPLKIVRSDIKLTLLDSLNKRINFLETLSDEIGLEAQCIHGRAEELAKGGMREAFDCAVARAVARLNVLCEYCLPYVKVGGEFIALKGSSGREELDEAENAVKTLGGEVEHFEEYCLPCGDKRSLIVIRKTRPTDTRYPRNKGQMTKKPL